MILKNHKIYNPILFVTLISSLLVTSFSTTALAKAENKNVKLRKKRVNITWLKKQNREPNLLSERNLVHNNNGKKNPGKQQNLLSQPQSKLSVLARNLVGKASWYGPKFHGRPTASGEIFNQNGFTAAHPYLRFGTQVRVTNLNNGRSVIVRINDRGPYAHNRIIDLSKAAASTIGLVNSGVAPVKIEVLGQ
ncbi:MAG: hypothetical protein Tsb0014_10510 [Pleurocapsa sp.]